MGYRGSEAVWQEAAEERRANRSRELERRPSFEVVTGGGLDARARAGLNPSFLVNVKRVAAVAAVVLAVGFCRIQLSTATVSSLRENSRLRTEISSIQASNDDLQVERSILSSSSRINKIATDNYGMVLSPSREVIKVNQGDRAGREGVAAHGDAAQPGAAEQSVSAEA